MDPQMPPEPEPQSESVKSILAEMERTAATKPAKVVKPASAWRSGPWWKVGIGVVLALMFLPLVMFFLPEAPLGSQFEGYIDPDEDAVVTGWVWDSARPDKPISVEINDGVHPKVTVLADRPRGDLKEAGKGNGRHGFRYVIPPFFRDGKEYTVSVRIVDTQRPLDNSPRKITYVKDAEAAKVR